MQFGAAVVNPGWWGAAMVHLGGFSGLECEECQYSGLDLSSSLAARTCKQLVEEKSSTLNLVTVEVKGQIYSYCAVCMENLKKMVMLTRRKWCSSYNSDDWSITILLLFCSVTTQSFMLNKFTFVKSRHQNSDLEQKEKFAGVSWEHFIILIYNIIYLLLYFHLGPEVCWLWHHCVMWLSSQVVSEWVNEWTVRLHVGSHFLSVAVVLWHLSQQVSERHQVQVCEWPIGTSSQLVCLRGVWPPTEVGGVPSEGVGVAVGIFLHWRHGAASLLRDKQSLAMTCRQGTH